MHEKASMKIPNFLHSKLNAYSIIGSIAYGAICAFTTIFIPNPPFRFYLIYTFVAAVLFYFGMYVWYTSKPRNGVLRFIGRGFIKFIITYLIGIIVVGFVYSIMYHTSIAKGVWFAAECVTTALYYTPFIP